MKVLLSILIVLVVIFGGWKLFTYWEEVDAGKESNQAKSAESVSPRSLSGMPSNLEGPLSEVTKKGPSALKEWLEMVKSNQLVKDPRLAWIELDYVEMISRENPVEAKRVFAEVKNRVESDSPVYPRIKALEQTYE